MGAVVDKAEGGAVMTNVRDLAIYVSEQTYIYSKNNGSDQNIFDGYSTDRDQIDTSPNHPR